MTLFPGDLVSPYLVANGAERISTETFHVIWRDPDGLYHVRSQSGVIYTFMSSSLYMRRCVNCKQGKSAHTEEGKCLYGPGNWGVS